MRVDLAIISDVKTSDEAERLSKGRQGGMDSQGGRLEKNVTGFRGRGTALKPWTLLSAIGKGSAGTRSS